MGEKSTVRIEDTRLKGQSKTYKIGDKTPGGTLIMIDYRLMPKSDNQKGFCQARIILKTGPDYWAIDANQYFSQKRLLKPDELPDELKQ